jgi:hypothetical protein
MWMIWKVQLTGLRLINPTTRVFLLAQIPHINGTTPEPKPERILRCTTRETDEHLSSSGRDMTNTPKLSCRRYWTGRAGSRLQQRMLDSIATSAVKDSNASTIFAATCSSTKQQEKRFNVLILDATRALTGRPISAVMSVVYTCICESTSASCVDLSLRGRIHSSGILYQVCPSPVYCADRNPGTSRAAAQNERDWIASDSKSR